MPFYLVILSYLEDDFDAMYRLNQNESLETKNSYKEFIKKGFLEPFFLNEKYAIMGDLRLRLKSDLYSFSTEEDRKTAILLFQKTKQEDDYDKFAYSGSKFYEFSEYERENLNSLGFKVIK